MNIPRFLILIFLFSCNLTSQAKFSQEEKQKAQLLIKTLNANEESIILSNSFGAYEIVSQDQINEVLRLRKLALEIAENIPNEVLIKINSGLPNAFMNYKKALKLRIKSLEDGNMNSEIEGSKLMDKWFDWYEMNRKKLKVPK